MLTLECNKIYIEEYEQIPYVSDQRIYISFNNKKLELFGKNLQVIFLCHDEIIISGIFETMRFYYE